MKVIFSVDTSNLTPVTPRGESELFFSLHYFFQGFERLIKSCEALRRIVILKVATFSMLAFSVI